jgi:hypothetical protein
MHGGLMPFIREEGEEEVRGELGIQVDLAATCLNSFMHLIRSEFSCVVCGLVAVERIHKNRKTILATKTDSRLYF